MRLVLLIPGILVMLLAVVLTVSPTATLRTQTATASTPVEFNATSPVSVTGHYPLSFSWGASSLVTIVAATCASVNSRATSEFSVCGGFSLIGEQTGINGAFSVSPKLGAIVFMWVLPVNETQPAPPVTVRIVGAEPLLGTILLGTGGAVAVLGILVRKKVGPPKLSKDDPESWDPTRPPPWAEQPPPQPPPEWE
jgi:hypothetical protein